MCSLYSLTVENRERFRAVKHLILGQALSPGASGQTTARGESCKILQRPDMQIVHRIPNIVCKVKKTYCEKHTIIFVPKSCCVECWKEENINLTPRAF